jgi:hypothetical protein
VYVRARTPIHPSLETKHLHEPGEDAEGPRRAERSPGDHTALPGVERWQIEMIRAPTSGGDERNSNRRPLLAKHGRDSAVTRAFTVCAGRRGDSRVVQRLQDAR